DAIERAVVPALFELVDESRVDQAATALRRPQPRTDRSTEQRGSPELARAAVEHRQVAVTAEPGQAVAELPNERALAIGGFERGRCAREQPLADEQPHIASHRPESVVELDGHRGAQSYEVRVVAA